MDLNIGQQGGHYSTVVDININTSGHQHHH